MAKVVRNALLALALAAGLSATGPAPAWANSNFYSDLCKEIAKNEGQVSQLYLGLCSPYITGKAQSIFDYHDSSALYGNAEGVNAAATVATPDAGTEWLVNLGGTMQKGEPNEGGKLTRSSWVFFKAPRAGRVVVHTFGSEVWDSGPFDPLLAVYRGAGLDTIKRITGSDNKPLAGVSSVDGLAQFDVAKGQTYAIQVGSKNKKEGIIPLNIFYFPPGGGVSAFPLWPGVSTNGGDYYCSSETTCPSVTFIVHNSTGGALDVTSSSSLGAGVTAAPASFKLAKGALKRVTFSFGSSFDNTTVRTVSGDFIVTGKVGGKIMTEARTRALVVRKPFPVESLIETRVTSPQVQTIHTNAPATFTAVVTNTGAKPAIGCHFFHSNEPGMRTAFFTVNPANGKRLTSNDQPVDIPAGASRTFKVLATSPGGRDADPFSLPIKADCANNEPIRASGSGFVPLLAGFDVSARLAPPLLPSIKIVQSAPKGDTLNVPAKGFAYFTFKATNTKATAKLDVRPSYEGPYDDPASKRYQVAICQTNLATGKCVGPYVGDLDAVAMAKGKALGFSVRIKAPAGSPQFDPDQRRVYVTFKQDDPGYFPVAMESVAVRKGK